MNKSWYPLTQQEVEQQLHVNPAQGLSAHEVKKRRDIYGFNKLPESPPELWVSIFLRQFKNPFIYLLIIAAIIKFLFEGYRDALIISVVIIVNALVGMIQEGRAQTILVGLKKILKTSCVVLRDGKRTIVQEEELVPGDILIIQEGLRVPADARIMEAAALRVDEASLTGESHPVEKTDAPIEKEQLPVADQHNMLFMGTFILSGTGVAIVVATGTATEMGSIQKYFEEKKPVMPLKEDLDQLAYLFLILSILATVVIFGVGLIWGYSWDELFFTLTSLLVSITPESIPIITTIVLAVGAHRMAKSHVLIKHLPAIEALGRVQVLIVDKTGTLTRNEQMVVETFAGNQHYTVTGHGYIPDGEVLINDAAINPKAPQQSALFELAQAAALLDFAIVQYDQKHKTFTLKGEPLQAALGVFAQKVGIHPEEEQKKYRLINESPFDPKSRMSSVTYQHNGQTFTLKLGSPEAIIQQCQNIAPQVKKICDTMLDKGLRLLVIAKNDQFLGFIGMQDALRSDVKETVASAKSAGLRIVMATGDHKDTALYVGKATGIYKQGDIIVEGKEFVNFDDETLENKLTQATVIARVTPADKIEIIRAYHYKGIAVGMTGDGVNDAPALASADVGIAMGRTGTEVAKEAADIVLLDDALASIIGGIRQGRHILVTLRRVILFLLVENISEVAVIGVAVFLGLPLPLLAVQVLWQHMITDSFLDIGLSMEPVDLQLQEYRHIPKKLLDVTLFKKMWTMILTSFIGTFTIFLVYYHQNLPLARTMVSVTFTFFQWFNAWNLRSETKSVFEMNPFKNLWLLGLALAVLVGQYLIFTTPSFRDALHFVALSWQQWALSATVASSIVLVEEARKRRK